MTTSERKELYVIFIQFLKNKGLWDTYKEHRNLTSNEILTGYQPRRWISADAVIRWANTGMESAFNRTDDEWGELLRNNGLGGNL